MTKQTINNKTQYKTTSISTAVYTEAQAYLKAHPEITTFSSLINLALNQYFVNARINEVRYHASRITQAPVPTSTNPPFRNDGKEFVMPNGKFYPANVTAPTSFGGPQTGGYQALSDEDKQRLQTQAESHIKAQIRQCQDDYNRAEALFKQGKVDFNYWCAAQEVYESGMFFLQAKLKEMRGN
jgi:hypothetical protein